MFDNTITTLLQKKLPHLPDVLCATSLKYDIDDIILARFHGLALAVIDDKYTSEAFGTHIYNALKGSASCTHVTLEGIPEANDRTAAWLQSKTARVDALIAVGSGTISDLCKYVSFTGKKPYAVFPTAASMNGYLSANASITLDGHKTTVAAHMPEAVFCDMSVIAAAPPRLSKSGLGDSLARPTAQADWLLSHKLLGTPYDPTPFTLLESLEPELFDHARGIALSDPQTLELLMKILLLSGLGMTIAGGSHPASQGEHMIAHVYEMLLPSRPLDVKILPPLHGEQIAITTLIMARMQKQLLRAKPRLRHEAFNTNKMSGLFGEEVSAEAKKLFEAKHQLCHPALVAGAGQDKIKGWDSIAADIERITLHSTRLHKILDDAQAPTLSKSIGWDESTLATATNTARFTRDRFTFLDLE